MSDAESPLGALRAKHGNVLINIDQTQYRRNALRNIGCNCSTCYTHMEAEDQEQIEHHIQTGGKYKEKQRNLTVADGPQE